MTNFDSADAGVPAVRGTNTATAESAERPAAAVEGHSPAGKGVYGHSVIGRGVVGTSDSDYGIRAHSRLSAGLRASSDEGRGLEGWSTKAEGVYGISESGSGVWGVAKSGTGVVGTSESGKGGLFESAQSVGVWGVSATNEAVHAETRSVTTAALAAYQMNPDSQTAALYAKHAGGRVAAVFEGDVIVSGDIALNNADCAEDFNISIEAAAEPGTVMSLDEKGDLRESVQAYDKRVAGVVSGAGSYKPGLILDKQRSQGNRKPVALLGKVFCKVDAQFGPIEAGDLLTTSPTPGHAMRAEDPFKAFGSVIGKALRPLADGQGLIPILVTLQ